ncbi:MAG TPA: rhodanese-like domain-containing protein [Vicinamibacterales bacterium]|nr:rhodanese-like domain-containing protein [Vicinamibacterales bacterium]
MNNTNLRTGRALAIVALALGAAAPFAGSPYRSARASVDVAGLAGSIAREEDHVTALELAAWIHDRKPGLRIIDVREPEEFSAYQIPTAENVPLAQFSRLSVKPDDTVVLYSGGGAHAAQAWVFIRAMGHRQVFFLSGGLNEWIDDVMNPVASTPITRYFGGVARPEGTASPSASTTADKVKQLRRRGC